MGDPIGIYDLVLVVALVGVAWQALFGRDPFTATIFFVAYGFFLSLIWVELGAPDVGLAEASIGAGLTGALLLGAVQQFERDTLLWKTAEPRRQKFVFVIATLAWGGIVFGALWLQRSNRVSLLPHVQEHLAVSGSTHPVTSVLLNFRAFDTWLELGVLFLAAMAALVLHRGFGSGIAGRAMPSNDLVVVISQVMLPLLVMVGGIMLWYGARDPGGAFQGGALWGAGGILLQLAGRLPGRWLGEPTLGRWSRLILVLGFAVFGVVAITTVTLGGRMLEYPREHAGSFILAIEVAAALSIALTLNIVYAHSAPHASGGP